MELTGVPVAHSERGRHALRAVTKAGANSVFHMRRPDCSDTNSQDDLSRENARDNSDLQG